jgi:DUF177 domain-containing protein
VTGSALSIPLAGLLSELPGATRHVEIDGATITLDDDLVLATPISGSVQIARTNRGVLVDAKIRASLAEECARCLRPVATPLAITIREEVLPSIDLATGGAVDASAEPEVARLSDHHELDLEALFREAISLAEPIAPLCALDCPGLCVVCGERLDAGHADHGDTEVDPRLAALRAFRVDAEPESE